MEIRFAPTCILLGPLVAVCVGVSSLHGQDGGLEISNLVSGSICRYEEETGARSSEIDIHANGSICEAVDIEVRGKGRCVYAGEEKPCTWYGFEFDYDNKDPNEPITCIWRRSQPTDMGDIERVEKRSAVADTFDLALEGASGHYRHPMYNLYAAPPAPLTIDDEMTCTYRGEPALETLFRLRFSPDF